MSNKQAFKKLINSDKPILIDFYATWCGPCKSMNPIIKELASELKEEVRVIKIDIDKNQSLAHKLGIRGVPTFSLYKDGKNLWTQSGMITKVQLKKILKKHLN